MSIFGYDDIADMFDGGGAGGSGDSFYSGSNEDYQATGGQNTGSSPFSNERHDDGGNSSGNAGNSSGSYTIQSGDTLSALAAKNGISLDELMKMNPHITDPNKIQAGGSLNLGSGNKVVGGAPEGIMDLAGYASPIGIIGKLAGWANGLDPKNDTTSVVDGRQVYTNSNGMQYSYNFLGMPYEVKVIDNKVVDALSIVDEETGLTGYQKMAAEARANGNEDEAKAIEEEAAQNAGEGEGEGETEELSFAEQVLKYAKEAGLVDLQADADAILADPMKFLKDRGLNVADLIPDFDANADGTTLDPNNPNYELGDDSGYEATTVNTDDLTLVDEVTAKEGNTYEAATNEITDDMLAEGITGEIRDENLVDAEKYTIDITGAATGVNEDGTKNELGLALNDWASVDLSKVIDTSTTAGKLLADKLIREGKEFVDAKTSIVWQMKTIAAEFKDANGNPVIPPWAQAVHRDAMRSISFSGISGTAATAAMSNAIMESMMGVAEKEADFFRTLTVENLSNKQEALINKAKVLSNLELGNLDARSQAAVQNAKAFLEMDLTNLDNQQQAEILNKQAMIDALFENTKAENAARRFGAETANEMQKFYDELVVNIQRHNSSEINAMKKANMGEINDAAQFNADIKNDREQFYTELQYKIDLANAKWRQTVETEQFRAEVDAYTTDVKNGLDLTSEQQAQLWDFADNLLDLIWKTTDNDQERELRLLIASMQAQSGQQGGSGFLEGLLTLGGAFLGSSSGSKWLANLLPTSDVRLKEDIRYYDTHKGVNFYTWQWNEEGKRIGADKYPPFGVLAQEVQKTHPEAVVEGPHGYLRVNYGMISNDV